MPHEYHVTKPELLADIEHVPGVSVKRAVTFAVIAVRACATHPRVVEQDDAMGVSELGPDEPPHVLIAAEPVGEHHRLAVGNPAFENVMTRQEADGENLTDGRGRTMAWASQEAARQGGRRGPPGARRER